MNMKIATKSYVHLRLTDNSFINDLSIIAVQFKTTSNQSDFVFNTVDFDKFADFNPADFNIFFDLLLELEVESKSKVFYALEYNDKGIVLIQNFHDSLRLQSKIDSDELATALQYIAEDNDFSYLEKKLLPLNTKPVLDQITADNDLPTLEYYLQKYNSEIKRVYYPGAGMDFSPLQLFGRHIKGVELFFTDYMSIEELSEVIDRLENNINTSVLAPQDFNQDCWEDFWPTNVNRDEMMGHEPAEAWGKKFEFQSKNLDCTLTYLGTEGVQTAKILCENELAPDVLVLQDHGGSTNYALFSDENSFLHQAMQNCLPKYILMDPTEAENTKIWPEYEQVTQVYLPKAYESLPQNRNPRALFKKEERTKS
ncbi:hypothetical protein [Psychroflexus salis]|uniref:Uncharacterized protein n=1 Tax=Psychroflexus salis TaxID=1526574 RepID=A0A917E980_9FLAO|nr:hypothetical protein [Psychroflexus salis]GGE15651.1 hypothetical protein GCM10010831_16200 [Psychroflexus salis]